MSDEQLQKVIGFIDETPFHYEALGNAEDAFEHHRIDGHIEARETLASLLGWTAPTYLGEHTRVQEVDSGDDQRSTFTD